MLFIDCTIIGSKLSLLLFHLRFQDMDKYSSDIFGILSLCTFDAIYLDIHYLQTDRWVEESL